MEAMQTQLPGVIKISPRIFHDSRGYLFESFSKKNLNQIIAETDFKTSYEIRLNAGQIMIFDLVDSNILLRCIVGDVKIEIKGLDDSSSENPPLLDTIDSKDHCQYFIPKGYKLCLSASEDSILEIQSDKELTWP